MDTHYDIIRLPEVESTQDVATDEAIRRNRSMLVVADRQVAGRGRQGRSWIEPDRGLYSSYAFRCGWPSESLPLLALGTAVAVRRAIRDVCGIDIACKWPNDLIVDDRKVGGILPDSSDDLVTIGCGVNLAWADPPEFAAAILSDPPDPALAPALAIAWVDELRGIVERGPDDWPRSEYESACVTLGRAVAWDGRSGRAVGIAPNGHLRVHGPDGMEDIVAGEVHLHPRN